MTNPMNLESAPETSGDQFRNAEHEGELIVLTVKDTGKDTFDSGESEFIVADITVVDGASKGETFEDAWVFGRVIFGQLKRKIGRTFVGRINKEKTPKKGKSPAWVLDPATADELKTAQAFMSERFTPPPAPAGGSAEAPAPTELGGDDDTPPWARG
jgi:hypothetical protein